MASSKADRDMFSLDGSVALVTGGGRGLGRGMAEALARAGADVVVVSRSEGELQRTREGLEPYGGRYLALPWDLQDVSSFPALIQKVVDTLGRLDILVHAAGIQVRKPAVEVAPDEWDRVQNVHLKAAFFLSSEVAKHLLARGSAGSIILVASLTSEIGIPQTAPYSAAKSGMLGLVRTLAVEWAPQGIRVNAIGPGYFHTDLTDALFRDAERRDWVLSRIPQGRPGVAEDLAGATVFLASGASAYVTGQVLYVDGGWLAG